MKYIKLLAILLVLVGCKDPIVEPPVDPGDVLEDGMLVLCEGLFQHNNASVSWFGFDGTQDNNFFQTRTNRELGDTGNDMKRYGGKIYIVVNVSSTIEVMDAFSFKPLQQINMQANGQPKQPRSLAFANGKVYVTCFDGFVDVIDTSSLSVTQRIPVGANPEGLAVANNKLFVANSGGLNFPNVDSTVSVIDLSVNAEITRITVGNNPGGVFAAPTGEVYVIARGNYGSIPSRMKRIDAGTNQLVESYSFDVSGMTGFGSTEMLVYNGSGISSFNYQSHAINNANFVNLSGVQTLYNVSFNANKNAIYVMDAMQYTNLGFVRKFSTSGSAIESYPVGLNPSKILFYD